MPIDAGDVIVYLFRPEVREFAGIEKMWTRIDAGDRESWEAEPLATELGDDALLEEVLHSAPLWDKDDAMRAEGALKLVDQLAKLGHLAQTLSHAYARPATSAVGA